jgi:hypothetical protein
LTAFDPGLLIGGAVTALFAGVATAEFALEPIRHAVTAQEAPSLDMAAAADTPEVIQSDLTSGPQASPPPVTTPVSASTAPQAPADITDEPTSKSEEDVQEPDDSGARADQERAPTLESDRAPEEVAQTDFYDEQDRDAPALAVNSPAEDLPPAAVTE